MTDWAWTIQLETLEKGTRVTMRISDPGEGVWDQIGPEFMAGLGDQATTLQAILETM